MEYLFLAVLNRGLAAGWLIAAVIMVRFLIRKRALKSMVCMMWVIAGVRLACPISAASDFSLLPEKTGEAAVFSGGIQAAQEAPALPKEALAKQKPAAPAEAVVPESGETHFTWIQAAAYVWLLGVLLMGAFMAYSWRRVKINTAAAVPAEYEGTKFYFCGGIETAFLFGLAAPKIYVPFSAAGAELSFILKHESAHKNRRDHLRKAAGYALLAVYWFHPLVWAAYILMCRDIELACDEKVIRELGAGCKKEYAQALLACAVKNGPAAVYPVTFGEIGVKSRVKNILNYKKPKFQAFLAAACACVIVTACFATEAKSRNTTEKRKSFINDRAAAQAVQTAEEDPALRKFLEEWAVAFCGRDGAAVSRMLDDAEKKEMEDAGLLQGDRSFGWSSPWPWEVQEGEEARPNYRLLSLNKDTAVILYYAWTSDPHVTVWRQTLSYRQGGAAGSFRISGVDTVYCDSIDTAEEFYAAYPNGIINGTPMDYRENGTGGALNDNLLLSSTNLGRDLATRADKAAVYLLNVEDDPSKVKAEVSQKGGETVVTFTFQKDGSTASVKMVRYSGEHSIWIPQTDDMSAPAL